MLWQLLKPLLIFPKGLLGGLISAIIMWMAVIVYYNLRLSRNLRNLGYEGPVAVAGGWQYLAQLPWVVALLAVAFGLGFYLVVAWVARHP